MIDRDMRDMRDMRNKKKKWRNGRHIQVGIKFDRTDVTGDMVLYDFLEKMKNITGSYKGVLRYFRGLSTLRNSDDVVDRDNGCNS